MHKKIWTILRFFSFLWIIVIAILLRQEREGSASISQVPFVYTGESADYESLYDQLEIVRSSRIDTQYPERFQADTTGMSYEDIEHRLQLLPSAQDSWYDSYIVAPSIGAVAPIHAITGESSDNYLFDGVEEQIVDILERWVVRHPHTYAPRNWTGNMVIAWHTSYYHKDPGRYKTFFQFVPLLQLDDVVVVFTRTDAGRNSYLYRIEQSYITHPQDTSILDQNTNKKVITLYGCYPFGTVKDRRVVKGTLIREWEIVDWSL